MSGEAANAYGQQLVTSLERAVEHALRRARVAEERALAADERADRVMLENMRLMKRLDAAEAMK